MWVARDKNGVLVLFAEKPVRYISSWDLKDKCADGYSDGLGIFGENFFPDLTWEDEPIEVDLVRRKTSEEILDDVLYSKFGM